ncbi:MAG: hypothetical protein V1739_09290 [Candidatus Omnitrophota bacterium]
MIFPIFYLTPGFVLLIAGGLIGLVLGVNLVRNGAVFITMYIRYMIFLIKRG